MIAKTKTNPEKEKLSNIKKLILKGTLTIITKNI